MNNPVDFAPDLSAFKKDWLPLERAIQRVAKFEHDFGKTHLSLACHVALASILTPELVNLIRINFLEKSVEWIAESDLLLSSLCTPIHQGIYEIEPQIRQVLLVALQKDPAYGTERLEEIASLLYFYHESSLANKLPMYIKRTYQWISSAYLDPDVAVQNMVNFLENTDLENLASRIVNYQLVGKTLAILANPLELSNLQVELDDLVDSTYLIVQGYTGKADFSTLVQHNSYTLDETIQPLTSAVVDLLIKLSPDTSDYIAAMPTQSITPSTSHIPNLSAPSLQEALETALTLTDEENRVRTLAELTPYLSASQLHKALEVARSISNVERRVRALIKLLPHLSESVQGSVLQEALEAAHAIANERSRAEALTRLAPNLSVPLLQEALEVARALIDDETRASTLAELAPYVKQLTVTDTKPVTIFCSYSHNDEYLLRELEKYLMPLQEDGLITYWHDRMVSGGVDPEQEINKYLNISQIILLLVSADFLASDYCYGTELKRALERHQNGEAHVIPIILRPVDWNDSPFAHLQALPTDARPITTWSNRDTAFADVAAGIRKIIEGQKNLRTSSQTPNLQRHPVNIHPIEVFCCYAPEDEAWLRKLEMQLSLIKRQGFISLWHDQPISPGTDRVKTIDTRLETASIIILLVSADFLASDYCYGIEMQRAMQRHEEGSAYVIPVILRPADWQRAPFAHLQALPTDAKPLTTWHNPDDGLVDIAAGIRLAIKELSSQHTVLPKLWNIPLARNPFFSGREDILSQLHEQLNTSQATALSQVQALSGLGGIGKTQIAIEYAYRYSQEYQAVFWANAYSQEALISSYTNIANLLNLPEQKEQESTLVIQAVKHWLQTHYEWLLVLDDADDLGILPAFLPSSSGGHLLLTTRAATVEKLARRLNIVTLSQEEGALFLLRRARILAIDDQIEQASSEMRDKAIQIVQELGGLPLALDQAGAYIETTNASLNQYLQVYLKCRNEVLNQRGDGVSYPDSVATTWSLAFAKVEQSNPIAPDLLRLCAFLSPENIPETIFSQGAHLLGSQLALIAKNISLLDEAIAALRAYSLLNRDPQTKTLSIHRLVQTILYESMSQKTRRLWSERAIRVINEVFPEVDFAHWAECELYLPHALVCSHWIEQEIITLPEVAKLLYKTGSYLIERAQYAEAEPLFKQALAIQEHRLGNEHPDTARSLNNLALLYQGQGRYAEAQPLFERALAISQRVLGEEHPDTARSLNNLALLYQGQGRYAEAQSLLEQALTISQHVLGEEHPDTATSLNNLAGIYLRTGQPQRSLEVYQRALSIRQKVGDHAGEATTLNNVADVYARIGQPQRALELYEQVLPIIREVGDRAGEVTTLNNIADVYYDIGQLQRALELYEQVLPMRREVGDRRGEATTLNNIALVYHAIGQSQRALELYEQVLPIIREIGDRAGEATTLNNIADVYARIGRPQRALELYEQVLPIICEIGDRAGEATTLNNIADVYYDLGQLQRALELYEQVLPIRREVGDRRGEAVTLNNIALVYHAIGQSQRALELYEQVLPIRREVGDRRGEATTLNNIADVYFKIEQPQRAIELYEQALSIINEIGDRATEAHILNSLANIYQNLNKYLEAESLLQRALHLQEQVFGSKHSDTATSLNNLAILYKVQGKYEEAEPLFLRALHIQEQVLGPDHPFIANTLHNLAVLYQGNGSYQQARSLYQRAITIYEIYLGLEHPQTQMARKNFADFLKVAGIDQTGAISANIDNQVQERHFDAFLCYNAKDKDEVKAIAEQLRAQGIVPWLDEWELPPGRPWQSILEKQIHKIKSAVVFIGENGVSPWQSSEIDALLQEFAKRSCPVIPVLLKTAPSKANLPGFLASIQAVDFKKQEPDAIRQLIWGITGKRSDNPDQQTVSQSLAAQTSIHPGTLASPKIADTMQLLRKAGRPLKEIEEALKPQVTEAIINWVKEHMSYKDITAYPDSKIPDVVLIEPNEHQVGINVKIEFNFRDIVRETNYLISYFGRAVNNFTSFILFVIYINESNGIQAADLVKRTKLRSDISNNADLYSRDAAELHLPNNVSLVIGYVYEDNFVFVNSFPYQGQFGIFEKKGQQGM